MSNTGQTDRGFNCDYHHDINLLLERQEYDADTIMSLKSQVEFEMNEKGLARIKRDEYAKCIAELEKELSDTKYDQLASTIDAAEQRISELELALLYYADEGHFKNGDVPGHIYAMDDAGHIARNALGIDQKEVDRRVLATYYTE